MEKKTEALNSEPRCDFGFRDGPLNGGRPMLLLQTFRRPFWRPLAGVHPQCLVKICNKQSCFARFVEWVRDYSSPYITPNHVIIVFHSFFHVFLSGRFKEQALTLL